MLEIPNLNTVYEDESATFYIHDIAGEGKILVLHALVIPTTNRVILNHYQDIVESICQALKERGINQIEAWVNTDQEIRYAEFFGFTETLGELTVNKQSCFPAVFRLMKRFD